MEDNKSDAVLIRVPYRNLKRAEVELVAFKEDPVNMRNSSSVYHHQQNDRPHRHYSLITLILSSTIDVGVQFGWALQLSLLPPFVQVLCNFKVKKIYKPKVKALS